MSDLPSLYAISTDLALLLDRDDMDPADLEAEVERLLPALEQKTAGVAAWVEYQQDLAAAIHEREKKVVAARKVLEARAEKWKDYLKRCMTLAGAGSVTDPRTGTTVTLQRNPPRVEIEDEGLIPDEYKRKPPPPAPVPDKKIIAEALKDGVPVPGAKLIQDTRIVIK